MRPCLRRLVHFFDRFEINPLLVAPDQNTWFGHRDHALLLLAVQTGLRLSELTGLRRNDVALGTGAYVRCVGKGRKERCTPLTTTTVAVLKAWLRRVLQLARLLDLLRSSFVLASSMVSLPGLHNGLPQCCPSLSGGGGETSQEK